MISKLCYQKKPHGPGCRISGTWALADAHTGTQRAAVRAGTAAPQEGFRARKMESSVSLELHG